MSDKSSSQNDHTVELPGSSSAQPSSDQKSSLVAKGDPVIQQDQETEELVGELSFFNYHEFVTEEALPSGSPPSQHAKSFVVNHFPNDHANLDSATYHATRIVRIPRTYETLHLSDIIPQFSEYVPGNEPNAIKTSDSGPDHLMEPFVIKHEYDGNYFGETSVTPLVPGLMSEEELVTIIGTVNEHLRRAFDPYSVWNFLDTALDFLTGTLYSKLFNNFVLETYCKRKLVELEIFIREINETYEPRGIKFISPRRTGYTSLDIQIPRPIKESVERTKEMLKGV